MRRRRKRSGPYSGGGSTKMSTRSSAQTRARRSTTRCAGCGRAITQAHGESLGLYKILFHCKAFLWESVILLLPPHLQSLHYCNTIARLLRNIRPSPPTPRLYAIHYTIVVMAISCKGQCVPC